MCKGKNRWFLRKILVLIVGLVMAFSLMTPAFAAKDIVYIQCSVNLYTWHITAALTVQSVGALKQSPELKRMGEGALDALSDTSDLDTLLSEYETRLGPYAEGFDTGARKELDTDWNAGWFDTNEENRLMMFPSDGNNNSNDIDMAEATRVQQQLCIPLNEAIDWYLKKNNITKTENIYDFYNAMKGFLEDVRDNSDEDTYSIEVDGATYSYLWRVLKYSGETDSNRDRPEYVTWGYIIYEAVNNYVLVDSGAVREDNAYATEVGTFEKIITDLLDNMLNQLRNLLGYWSMDSLLFNAGNERTTQYVGGIFPKSWEPTIWALFMVTEIISAMIIMAAILTNVLKRASSTLNTFARTRMMKQIEDIIICAVLLSVLPLLLRLLISFSNALTEMAYAIVPQSNGRTRSIDDSVATFLSAGGTLGGVIGEFMYFGIQTYVNFFYAIRSLTVSVLIAIAPLMITFIAISDAKKQAAITWARELMANVFIQPIHAFIMAIVLVLPPSNHSFDNIIALYALIPITSMIRNLFFGQAGSWADQVAQKARARTTGAVAGAAIAGGTAIATGAVGGVRNAITAGRERDGNNAGNTSSQPGTASDVGGQGNAATNNIQGDANATRAAAAAGAGAGAGAAAEDTNENAREANPGASAAADGNLNNISNGTIPAASAVSAAAPSGTDSASGATSRSAAFAANHPRLSKMGRAAVNGAKTVGRGALGGAIGIGKALPGAALTAIGAAVGAAAGGSAGSTLANMGNRLVHNSTQPKERKNKKPAENTENSSTQQPQNSSQASQQQETQAPDLGVCRVAVATDNNDSEQAPDTVSAENLDINPAPETTPESNSEISSDHGDVSTQKTDSAPVSDLAVQAGSDKSAFEDSGIIPDGSGGLAHKYNTSPDSLKGSGMTITDADEDNITAKIDPKTATGEAADLVNYNSYVQSLEPDKRQQVMNGTGIYTSTDANGNIVANINKAKWSANTGNTIKARSGQDGTGLQITSKEGSEAPSLVSQRSQSQATSDLGTQDISTQRPSYDEAAMRPAYNAIKKANPNMSEEDIQQRAAKATQYKELRNEHPTMSAAEVKKMVDNPSEYYSSKTMTEPQKKVMDNAVAQGAASQKDGIYHADKEQMEKATISYQAAQETSQAPTPPSPREYNRSARKHLGISTPERVPSGPTSEIRTSSPEPKPLVHSSTQEPIPQERSIKQEPIPHEPAPIQEPKPQERHSVQERMPQERSFEQEPTSQERSYTQESNSKDRGPDFSSDASSGQSAHPKEDPVLERFKNGESVAASELFGDDFNI